MAAVNHIPFPSERKKDQKNMTRKTMSHVGGKIQRLKMMASFLYRPLSLLESGGRYLALGFPRLCGVGPVEPDK